MYKTALNLKRLLLIGGDVLALQAALVATLWLRYGQLNPLTWQQHQTPFLYITALWVVGLFVAGLYDLSKSLNGLAFFRLFLEGMIVNLLVAFAFFYLVPVFGIEPRTNLLLYFAIALLLLYVWRLLFNTYVARGLFRNRLLYVGPSEDALMVCGLLKGYPMGFQLCAVIHTTPRTSHDATGVRWEDRLAALDDVIARERINAIVLGHSLESLPELRDALYRTLYFSTALIDRKELEETLTGRVPVAMVTKAWFLENLRESEKTWYEAVKRALDVLLAIPFGILTIAVTPLVAIVIKLSSRGPVFYSQNRVGKGGSIFKIWKFRTMHADAEKNGPQFTASAKRDPRLFWAGRVMRQLRVDELPQIWNVLKGDLSFIGPRPERPEFVSPLVERMPYYSLRHLTRPGLTGWAQIQFLTPTASLEDNLKKLQYDLYYIKHRSLILDLAILLKTIGIVVRRQGT
ncbi:MAG TPA: exopolysaccharide biosynthesis polyprenyl glycosylphosphotransferase [Candidatus Methylomirabilis sp.]|nr:exopolysaccharide biosynthesis polyprenyl glycosylphosphotransferase [Candidatus Methylomirabilis sp.]